MTKIFNNKWIHYAIILLVFVALLFYYYYGIFHFDYPVPPGDDGIRHMTEAKHILQSGSYKAHAGSADPPLFHILLATLTSISQEHLVSVTKIFTPFLAILVTFSIYLLARRYFNRKLALLSLLLFAFVSPQPWQIYEDGTYLNLIAAEFFLVLMLAFLPRLLKFSHKPHWKYIILVALLAGSVILSHSLSTVYLLMLLGTVAALCLYLKLRRKKVNLKNVVLAYLIIALFLPLTWHYYLAGAVDKTFIDLGLTVAASGQTAGDSFFLSFPPPFSSYLKLFSSPLAWLAVGGTFLVLVSFLLKAISWQKLINLFTPYNKYINFNFDNDFLSNDKKYFEKWILLIWAGVLLIGSRFSFFIFPARLARDMIIPVCILAALFLYFSLSAWLKHKLKTKIAVTAILTMFFASLIINKAAIATQYHDMMRVQPSDEQAIAWIGNSTKPDDTILVMSRTIAVGEWGSYIDLLTERKTLDASICPAGDDKVCDPIYKPMSQLSVEYYRDNSIDYVYSGKKILGDFMWKDKIDWKYTKILPQVPFLERVAVFPESKELGSVIIYKVDQEKLSELAKSDR